MAFVWLIGCITTPEKQMNVSDLIGKWHGPMTVSAYPETGHRVVTALLLNLKSTIQT